MSTDRELLELAAKAAGYEYHSPAGYIVADGIPGNWNPLTDDGDALRLAVDLSIQLHFEGEGESEAVWAEETMLWIDGGCRRKATRRAITRAAAEIGRAMQ